MRTVEIARVDLVRRLRNRSAIVTAFVGPFALAAVFSVLIGGASSGSFTIGIASMDDAEETGQIVDGLLAGGGAGGDQAPIEFEQLGDESAARAAVDDDEVDAALVFPPGFGAAATSGEPTELIVVRSPDRAVSGQVAEAVAAGVAGGFRQVDVAVRTVATISRQPPTAELVAAAAARAPALALEDMPAGDRAVDVGAFYGAAMSILFLFFTVGFAGRSILEERRDGTLSRVLATPTSAGEVLAGKTISVAVLAFWGFVTVWLATTVLFDADWGNSVAVVAVIATTVLAVAGVSTFAASLARTERQADAITSMITFALALLGGNFVGPNAPEALRRLSLLTPNGWSLRAFGDLSADTVGIGGVVLPLVVLCGFAALFGAVGISRLHRKIST